MSVKTGRFAVLEQFLADGMHFMFGNPGTVEQGFLDALRDYPDLQYILTLQESVAVLMADGYARATKKPTLVQLHSTPGVGNGIGALYQAKRGHSPLVVVGGDAGFRVGGVGLFGPLDAEHGRAGAEAAEERTRSVAGQAGKPDPQLLPDLEVLPLVREEEDSAGGDV